MALRTIPILEIFDKNYLAEGNTDFNFVAPEVRDFVNRSRPSS